MPSVGSILLTVQAKTDDLEKNLAKAQQKIRDLEASAKRSGAGMAQSLTASSKAADALGQSIGKAVGQRLAQGLLLASSAMRVFDKTQDETTKGLLEGGAKIATAFAVGGPIFGAVIAGLELWAMKQEAVANKLKEAREESRRLSDFRIDAAETLKALAEADASAVDKLNTKIEAQLEIMEALQSKINVSNMFGGNATNRATVEAELKDRERIVAKLREQIRYESALESLRLAALGRKDEIAALRMEAAGVPSGQIGLMQQIAQYEEKIAALSGIQTNEARKQVRELSLQLEGTRELLGLSQDIAATKVNEEILREIETRSAITDEMREQLDLSRQLSEWTKKGASPALVEQLRAATLRSRVVAEWRPVFQTIESALTDAIVDGLTNGFRNGSDIARRLVNQLLSQLIGSIVSSGIQSLFGGIFGGGGGGGGIASIATSLIGAATGGGGGGGGGGVLPLPIDTGFT